MAAQEEVARLTAELARLGEEFRTVSSLGMRLSRELDPKSLLPAIVSEARRFTSSEAGTLYVKRGDRLAFAVAQNDALDRDGDGAVDEMPSFELPVDGSSLAGLAASEKRTLNIADAREHASFSRASSDRFKYEVRSMLVVPLVEPDGDVLGVLQLMNGRDAEGAIAPYDERSAELVAILGSHAATALVIAGLYAELQEVFDSLINYTAAAIDARDPCTAGHSSRVAAYAVRLAREMNCLSEPELRELRFAGIFHDVGKIGVRECVLTKSDKIPPEGMEAIGWRFTAACEATLRAGREQAGADDGHPALAAARERARELQDDLAFLRRITSPSWLADDDLARLRRIGAQAFTDASGTTHALLREGETEMLAVRKGNLTDAERREIQHHVQLSYEFLRQMPFPKDLARVPEIAWSHHEKLDGSGYPRGLAGEAISLQARLLTVADVFDALTAEDRPYKKSMTPERALSIIEHEAAQGAYDERVVGALRALVAGGRLVPRAHGQGRDDSPFDASRDAW